jgi:hypothetical protein
MSFAADSWVRRTATRDPLWPERDSEHPGRNKQGRDAGEWVGLGRAQPFASFQS